MNSATSTSIGSLNDEEIVERVLRGETYLYEALMRKFNSRLYRICMAIINDDIEAEDVMQTAYINAYLHLSSFQNKSTFSTWLTRILINECLLHQKKKKKASELLSQQIKQDAHNETAQP